MSLLDPFKKLAHYVWGFLTALVAPAAPVLSAIMFIGFIVYELDEEWHIRDKSYRDIQEMLTGLGIGAITILILAA